MGSCFSIKEPTQERKNNETNDVVEHQDGHENHQRLLHHILTDDNVDSLEPGGSNPTLGIQHFEMSSELQEINYEITTMNTSAIQY